ncbi:DUF4468 domain-containing protein [Flavobacterium anhuiense]|uniref:DUF4468 domain-containing protein n=1 Tax=Flavobacterium anhuiense TaxID=459526 RepID=UPI003D985FA4
MKLKIIMILGLISFKCFSQSLVFEKVIYLDSTYSKEILFERLNSKLIEFLGGQDKFNKNIIQSDKSLGVIKFKQELSYNKAEFMNSANGIISYNANVYFKDGRAKIILNSIFHKGMGISMDEITNDAVYPHEEKNYLKYRNRKWTEIKDFVNIELPKNISVIESIIRSPLEQESNW